MKKGGFLLLVMCFSLPVFSQGAGGHVTPPNKKPLQTQQAKKPQKGQVNKRSTQSMGSQIETFTVNGVPFKMIRVEGGSFQMGSPDNDFDAYDDEKPQHKVTLRDYYISETQVNVGKRTK